MQLAVIGCGKMATALVAGAIRAGTLGSPAIRGFDPFPAPDFQRETGASVSDDFSTLAGCDTFLLSTKPQQAEAALAGLSGLGDPDALLISIAAGLTIRWLETRCPASVRVIRTMPNTPALVGKGAAAFARGSRATADDAVLTARLLGSVGLAVETPEHLLDAVTGLSGSGPAFIYLAIEALVDGGVRNGLPPEQALKLAAQTVLGAAAMVLETDRSPAELRDMVTSPGGTTLAGLASLEKNGFRAALIEAVTAATRRATELGRS